MLEKESDLLKREDRREADRRPQTGRRADQDDRQLSALAQMDRLFDEVFKRPFFHHLSQRMSGEEMEELNPPIDIYQEGDSVVVKAEIPGLKREDLDVQLSADNITISGQKSKEQRIDDKDYYRMERSYGSFIKTCRLPVAILTDTAKATFRDGILEVRALKKTEMIKDHFRKLQVE
ncbi:Hsp20/alpha crystallin family protein [Geomonas paludis]|uniref:Heat-shock protein Hsp20 n=1 Tax=Geomonas paludis TaxID=2740185 RepID=A0A6V8MWT4_9BACT|nr:Hsp20/alpha crystallin family protein [Geomonas paludis]UPU34181.1 Hsp20/alpha crystallin family protein [Geomonas paludis]GFO64157.1 heat-shock protein Hsp20 [Geomonas paludis]